MSETDSTAVGSTGDHVAPPQNPTPPGDGPALGVTSESGSSMQRPELPPSLVRPVGVLLLSLLPFSFGHAVPGALLLVLGGVWLGASFAKRKTWEKNQSGTRGATPSSVSRASEAGAATPPVPDPEPEPAEMMSSGSTTDQEPAAPATDSLESQLSSLTKQLKQWDRTARAAADGTWPDDAHIANALDSLMAVLEEALKDDGLHSAALEAFDWLDGLYEPVATHWYQQEASKDGVLPPFVSSRNALIPILRERSPEHDVDEWEPESDLDLPPVVASEESGRDEATSSGPSDPVPPADDSAEMSQEAPSIESAAELVPVLPLDEPSAEVPSSSADGEDAGAEEVLEASPDMALVDASASPSAPSLPVVNAIVEDAVQSDDFQVLFGGSGSEPAPPPASVVVASPSPASDEPEGPNEPQEERQGTEDEPLPPADDAETAVSAGVSPETVEASQEDSEGPPPPCSAAELAEIDPRLHPVISGVQEAYRKRLDWDYYSFIGASQGVSAVEAKKAINALARGYRAVYDVKSLPENVRAEARALLVRLKLIRTTLTDDDRRRDYDESLSGTLDRAGSSMTMESLMALSADKLETIHDLDLESGLSKAKTLVDEERWSVAYSLLQRLRERWPSEAEILALLGWAASHMTEVPADATEQVGATPMERADEWLTLSLTFDKRQPLALRYLSVLRMNSGDWEAAHRALRAYATTRHDLSWAGQQIKTCEDKLSETQDDGDGRRGAWKLWKKS